MTAIAHNTVLPAAKVSTIRLVSRKAIDHTAIAAQHRNGFADGMEFAMSGVVILGVLLFAAALLHYGIPACALRTVGLGCLYSLAAIAATGTIAMLSKALFHLVNYVNIR